MTPVTTFNAELAEFAEEEWFCVLCGLCVDRCDLSS
jgi:NAD-dependent dihydropyrimidine dehydrogenase PreA subunit